MNTQESKALVQTNNLPVEQLQPTIYDRIADPIIAAEKLGSWIAKSGMFHCEKQETGMVLAFACMTMKKSPIELVAKFHITAQGLVKKAPAQLAEFQDAGGLCEWVKDGDDGIEASANFTIFGKTTLVRFTIETARSKGLVKKDSQWEKDPGAMLRARVVTKAMKMLLPRVVIDVTDDDEEQPRQVNSVPLERPLFSQPATATPSNAPVESARVIDVAATPIADTKPTNVIPIQTQQQPAATPTQTAATTFKAEEKDGKLTVETVRALEAAITEQRAEKALTWFLKKGWLKQGELLNSLPAKRAQSILDKPTTFHAVLAKEN